MVTRKSTVKTAAAPASGLSFARTTVPADTFKTKRAGGERGSRFVIDPAVQEALVWTTEAPENGLTIALTSFPAGRTRVDGQMVEGPATVDSARRYLDLHAEPLGLGVKVRDAGDGNVHVKAGKRVQRPRKSA
jgi:hypothetical protein